MNAPPPTKHLNNPSGCDTMDVERYPLWVIKLMRRVGRLERGRWQIILTVDERDPDWTVIGLGKVER